jgi:hypothetical protein
MLKSLAKTKRDANDTSNINVVAPDALYPIVKFPPNDASFPTNKREFALISLKISVFAAVIFPPNDASFPTNNPADPVVADASVVITKNPPAAMFPPNETSLARNKREFALTSR